jgi:hypothetical protein
VFGIGSILLSCWAWFRPVPLTVNDESSFLGEVFVIIVMTYGVCICTGVGALLGWLAGYLVATARPEN